LDGFLKTFIAMVTLSGSHLAMTPGWLLAFCQFQMQAILHYPKRSINLD